MRGEIHFITLPNNQKRQENVMVNIRKIYESDPVFFRKYNPRPFWALTPKDVFNHNIELKSIYQKSISNNFLKKTKKNQVVNKIPCAISHVSIWKTIIDQKMDFAIIIEDDMLLLDSFLEKIPKILTHKSQFDICFLYLPPGLTKVKPNFKLKPDQLIQKYPGFWGNTGYLLTSRGAQILLNHLPIHDYKDIWIQKLIENRVLNASIVTENLIQNLGCDQLNCQGKCQLGSSIYLDHQDYHRT